MGRMYPVLFWYMDMESKGSDAFASRPRALCFPLVVEGGR